MAVPRPTAEEIAVFAAREHYDLGAEEVTALTAAVTGGLASYDATVVSRVLAAGGTIIGKTVCEDLCFSGSSFTSASGPVRNPWDRGRSAGGSSSGNAVALALGEVDVAIVS